jgi:acyl-CoA thioesterase-1
MRRLAIALLLIGFAASGCSGGGAVGLDVVGSPVSTPPVVYAAVGASETVGVGTPDPLRQAWPRVLWKTALPDAVFYDFGVSGSTVAQALVEQVPAVLAVHPDVVTVWLNVNDLIARVPVRTYGSELDALVGALRREGRTQVLVATAPRLDGLPAYRRCYPTLSPDCQIADQLRSAGLTLPPPAEVRARVDRYNAAIRRVAAKDGAIVVDLAALGNAPTTHPEYIADDGFHPSAAGAQIVAASFAAALPTELITMAGGRVSTPTP